MKTKLELHHHFEDLIQSRIEELGLTQNQAAELCGVNQPLISKIKTHSSFGNEVSIFTMVRMLDDLGVDVDFQVNVKKEPSRRWQRRVK